MSLEYGDKLFVFYDNHEIPSNKRYSYFVNHFSIISKYHQKFNPRSEFIASGVISI